MSSATMRRAASLMRNRANDCALSPWTAQPVGSDVSDVRIVGLGWESLNPVTVAVAHGPATDHIVSWHPAVALEVASWLDHQATRAEEHEHFGDYDERHWQAPLVIACAYLGEEATP